MCVKALSALVAGVVDMPSVLDTAVHGLTGDSRRVKAGDAFVALRGSADDAWRFVPEAVANGAVAVLLETEQETGCSEQDGALVVKVPALSRHQAVIADRFFGSPSKALHVIGVTGTNGKSSVTRFIAEILNAAGLRTATLGTLGYGFPDAMVDASHTTPDVISVQYWLNQFRNAGAHAVVMEVSSHALDQGRVDQVHFEGAVFTNLSRDHLDYHGDMARYGAAKARLFREANPRFAVINLDDAFGRDLVPLLPEYCLVWRYTVANAESAAEAEIRVTALSAQETGFTATVATSAGVVEISSGLLGKFNVSNLAAAIGTALALNLDVRAVADAVKSVTAPPGRLQQFRASDGLRVVVDYAHTPDALDTALEALAAHTQGKLWCVFGCGGDRDTGKRPLMGAIAERRAARLVITDDNPRSEVPAAIVSEILSGMAEPKHAVVEHDRARAIEWAVIQAAPEDLILVAGKGHENYQERDGRRTPFSDSVVVEAALTHRSTGSTSA